VPVAAELTDARDGAERGKIISGPALNVSRGAASWPSMLVQLAAAPLGAPSGGFFSTADGSYREDSGHYPSRRQMRPALKALVDFLRKERRGAS
jgi:hypothetical protein